MAERARQRLREKDKEKEAERVRELEEERKRADAEEKRRATEEAKAARERKARAAEAKRREEEHRAELQRALEEKKGRAVLPEELEAAERYEQMKAQREKSQPKKKQLSLKTIRVAEDSDAVDWVSHSMGAAHDDDTDSKAVQPSAAAAAAAAASVLAPRDPDEQRASTLLDLNRGGKSIVLSAGKSKALSAVGAPLPGPMAIDTSGRWGVPVEASAGDAMPAAALGRSVSSPIMPTAVVLGSGGTPTARVTGFLQRQHDAEREREERLSKLKREESERWERMLGVHGTSPSAAAAAAASSVASGPPVAPLGIAAMSGAEGSGAASALRPLSGGRRSSRRDSYSSPRVYQVPTSVVTLGLGVSGTGRAPSPIKATEDRDQNAADSVSGGRPKSRTSGSPRPPLHGKGRRASRGDGTVGL